MAITKVTTGLISGDAASIDLNIDANTLFLDADTNRVGIGTNSPGALLDVNGTLDTTNLTIAGAQGSDGQVLTSTGSGVAWETPSSFNADAAQTFNDSGAAVDFRIEGDTEQNLFFVDGSADKIGIGTASPTQKLDVVSTSAGNTTIPLVVRNSGSTSTGTEAKLLLSTVADDARGAFVSAIITDSSNGNALLLGTNTAGAAPTERMRIDSSGKIAIGTTSPAQALHVTSTGFAYGRFNNSSYTGIDIGQHTGGDVYLNLRDNKAIRFQTNNTERLVISNSGNISTHPPAGNHFVINEDGVDSDFRVESDGNAHMLFVDGGNNRVGIGTSSPSYQLDVYGDSRVRVTGTNAANFGAFEAENNAGVGVFFGVGGNGRSDLLDNRGYVNTQTASDGLVISNEGADPIIFAVGGLATSDEVMRIDSNGNVGIGTDSPDPATGQTQRVLDIRGGSDNNFGGTIRLASLNGSSYSASMRQVQGNLLFENTYSDTERVRIQSGGGISFNGDTAAANALDDYEEGTFTPSYSVGGGGSVTGVTSTNVGTYTKVGRMCTVSVTSNYVATSGTVPTYYLLALPFTAADTASGLAGGGFGQETGQTGAGMLIKVEDNSTNAIIWRYNGAAVPANSYFSLSFTYQTT